MSTDLSIVIAGATGLVGRAILDSALINKNIGCIYSLTRRRIAIENKKLIQWVTPHLALPLEQTKPAPSIGIIALGTTLKQAGNKKTLKAVDTALVIKVASDMQQLGIKHLFVISSLGASTSALSHYLRCKGEMEAGVQQLDIQSITFMQPGPLVGKRQEPRKDEQILQWVMKIIRPLLLGKLKNLTPIAAQDIANIIVHLATQKNNYSTKMIKRMNTTSMLKIKNSEAKF